MNVSTAPSPAATKSRHWRPSIATRSAVLLAFLASTTTPLMAGGRPCNAVPPPEPTLTPLNNPTPGDSFAMMMSCYGQPGAVRNETVLGAAGPIKTGYMAFEAVETTVGVSIASGGIKVKEVFGMPMFSRDADKRVNAGRPSSDKRSMTVATAFGQLSGSACDEQYVAVMFVQRTQQCEGGERSVVMVVPLVVAASAAVAKETAMSTAAGLESQADADPDPNPPALTPERPSMTNCQDLVGTPRPKPEDFTDPDERKLAQYEACVWDADCIRKAKFRAAAAKAKDATVVFGTGAVIGVGLIIIAGFCTGGVAWVVAGAAAGAVGTGAVTGIVGIGAGTDDTVAAQAEFETKRNACWKLHYGAPSNP